jgi:hypothetical protein
MRKYLRILGILLVIVSVLSFSIPVSAATTAPVTVTQQFAFIGISNSASAYTLNSDNSGTGLVAPSTTYWSNPLGSTTSPTATVVDGECEWTLTNSSNIDIDLTANMADFSGSGVNSTNSNAGTAGATSFGASTYISGALLSAKVVLKTSGSDPMLASVAPATTSIKWGIEFLTQTNAAGNGNASTSVLLITATAS